MAAGLTIYQADHTRHGQRCGGPLWSYGANPPGRYPCPTSTNFILYSRQGDILGTAYLLSVGEQPAEIHIFGSIRHYCLPEERRASMQVSHTPYGEQRIGQIPAATYL